MGISPLHPAGACSSSLLLVVVVPLLLYYSFVIPYSYAYLSPLARSSFETFR